MASGKESVVKVTNSEEKKKALDAAIAKLEKDFGKGAVMKLGESGAHVSVETVPTGCLSLDLALGLGGAKLGTSTDPEGNFKLSLPQQENTILIFSFIGMESQEVPVGDPKKPIKVILKETAENLKEVVVTGIFTRKKESFTGSASTYTASELKTAGTQNILQSLKTLDPSFAILDIR